MNLSCSGGLLLLDPALAAELGACGRRRIQEQFTVEHHLRQVEQLLRDAIYDRRAACC